MRLADLIILCRASPLSTMTVRGESVDMHVDVHLGIHQPEGDGLVPHQGLVMTLSVSYALLMVPKQGAKLIVMSK